MTTGRFDILILGCSSASPVRGRFPSSQIVYIQDSVFLIDCGEGTQRRLMEHKVKKSNIHHIFISHLHGDHVFGLPGLLTSMSLGSRKHPVYLYGPVGIRKFITTVLDLSGSHLSFDLLIQEVQDQEAEAIYSDPNVEIQTIPLVHRVPTIGYFFKEKPKSPSLDLEKLKATGLAVDQYSKVKTELNFIGKNDLSYRSADFLIQNESAQRSYAYCSDTIALEKNNKQLLGVNALYHETTYLDDLAEKAKTTGHSTALQVANLAKTIKAKMLITGHYSSRYTDLEVILEECRSVFDNVVLGVEGLEIHVE